jgi:hypothetical protein
MWNDIDFLRAEISRIEAQLAARNANSYDCDELRYDLSNFIEELESLESKLWTQLNRSAS